MVTLTALPVFESRLAKLDLNDADVARLDVEVDELTEDEDGDAAKVAKLRRWAAPEQLVGAPPRIQKVSRHRRALREPAVAHGRQSHWTAAAEA